MLIPYLLWCSLGLLTPLPQEVVHTVTFLVTAPENTTEIVLVGNLLSLGNWNPERGRKMFSLEKGKFQLSLSLPERTIIEYKPTRGSWETEVLNEAGGIPGNYQILVRRDTTITHIVSGWKDTRQGPVSGITGTVRYHQQILFPSTLQPARSRGLVASFLRHRTPSQVSRPLRTGRTEPVHSFHRFSGPGAAFR